MACRTSWMAKGLSSPSGAGAGLRISETVVAGASMSSTPSVSRRSCAASVLRP